MKNAEIPTIGGHTVTPKALLYQKYGNMASYTVEEVKESDGKECPGLVIPRQGRSMYRCRLELPDFCVTSGTFAKKKDAEQSAAKLALEKLGIMNTQSNLTVEEIWEELVSRLSYLFREEFLLSTHPLSNHFKAALRKDGELCGLVPISIIASCDSKLINLCKSIELRAESNLYWVIVLAMKAAHLSRSICVSGALWLKKQDLPSSDVIQACVRDNLGLKESVQIETVLIPRSMEKAVELLTLDVSPGDYYLDIIARKLGVRDCSHVLVSRTVGKASSEMRLYFPVPENLIFSSDSSSVVLPHENETDDTSSSFNVRASYFSGQNIDGDALLAAVGYKWNSSDLHHEDVSLETYYRLLIGRFPSGSYKLSRDAILTAELPVIFTTRSNWRGSFPRDLLCTFCRQHQLSEPTFSVDDSSGTCKKLRSSNLTAEIENGNVAHDAGNRESGTPHSYKCDVKILSKRKDIVIQCSIEDSCRKYSDAVQIASLKVLSLLDKYFKEQDMPVEKPSLANVDGIIHFDPQCISREIALCASVRNHPHNRMLRELGSSGELACRDQPNIEHKHDVILFDVEGSDSGTCPSPGSLVCISYSVSLLRNGKYVGEPLERKDSFEFEIGTGSVIHQLETCVSQMSVTQTARFITEMPPVDFIHAASAIALQDVSMLVLEGCCLEYSIRLMQVTEPMEDRIEQALFSPPLSKQRVQYAVRHINQSHASTLVDFGCGSGSLLDSLLDHPTTLREIVGVDISQKSLSRSAKALHLKLSKASDSATQHTNINSAILYDGSITEFDSRLYGFDIGTCLEVIEHMEEDQARLFGDIVLSRFFPDLLIVSTPNYEYNAILQRNNSLSRDEEMEERSQLQPFKFRNHDHKFEWTREQFNSWASELASKHHYSVDFDGVGGAAGVEPGFASQIAVFRKNKRHPEEIHGMQEGCAHPYEVIWEWKSNNS